MVLTVVRCHHIESKKRRRKDMESILVIVYIILGYWAANKVWYSKRVYLVSDGGKFFVQKMVVAIFLGWILIPVALVQLLLENGKGK